MEPFSWEAIGPLRVCITKEHRFGTDAFLLADFARPRRGDKVCDLCAGCGIVPLLWFRQPERTPALAYAVELLPQAVEQMQATLREMPEVPWRGGFSPSSGISGSSPRRRSPRPPWIWSPAIPLTTRRGGASRPSRPTG